MIEFSFEQILTNLLLAARWTIVLSIVSFVAGGVVGFCAARDARVEVARSAHDRQVATSRSSRARRS